MCPSCADKPPTPPNNPAARTRLDPRCFEHYRLPAKESLDLAWFFPPSSRPHRIVRKKLNPNRLSGRSECRGMSRGGLGSPAFEVHRPVLTIQLVGEFFQDR